MMEIIKPGTKIDFVKKRQIFFACSIIMMIVSIGLIFGKGFNLGIDFAGGSVVQVKFNQAVELEDIRKGLSGVIEGDFVIQNFGEPNEVLIRIVDHSGASLQQIADSIKGKLESAFAAQEPTIQRVEQVGPQVGADLKQKAFLAMLYASIGILLYIAIRFEFMFAIAAIIALFHDVILTMGIYSLSGKEFNLTVMAALLTAAGYSLNDKIVIFDRVREKVRLGELAELGWRELINKSLNETLSRTILTSLLTLFAVVSLYIFGGEVINGFALVMIIGIIAGTYSSIAVASMFVYVMRTKQAQKAKKGLAEKGIVNQGSSS